MFSIKELRMKKGISQSDLAKVLGLHLRTIQNYEAGTTDIPTKNINLLHQMVTKGNKLFFKEFTQPFIL